MHAHETPWMHELLKDLAARNTSPHTQAAYARDINDAWSFLRQEGLSTWQEVQAQHLRLWLASRHAQGLSARTLSRRLAAVRALFKQLRTLQVALTDPTQGLRLPRPTRNLPESIEAETLTHLLKQGTENPLEQRDLAMLELMYGSGLRLSEICNLNVQDIDLGTGEARISGKGRKTRIVPLGAPSIKALTDWLAQRSQFTKSGEVALFLSQQQKRVSVRNVQDRLTRLSRKRGIAGSPHPHMLRHACASHFLQNSGDLRAVQELLGHSNLSTTQIYTHLDFQHLAKTYDGAHPRARRKEPS